MSWPGFYALKSAWLFLLLIPLLVFYFLKLKRPRQEVPSLALWQQVINDQRVNSPFQKFKRSILLLLQLLMLLLLILAAMQPFLSSGAERAEYLPVLVDCSASMGAVGKDGNTRLELAKEKIDEIIGNMLPDQRMSLIAVNESAQRLTEFTNNKRILRDALSRLTVTDVGSKLEDSLRMTQALSRSVPIDRVLIFSDGNFPDEVDFELPFSPEFQVVESAGYNMGVTEFNARRAKASWDLFVRVTGSEGDGGEADAILLQDGEEIAREAVVLESGESQPLVFNVATDDASSFELRLKTGKNDALASDNSAFLSIPESRPIAVFCSESLSSWRHAFGVSDLINLSDPKDEPTEVGYDILVTDDSTQLISASGLSVAVGIVPDDLAKLVTIEEDSCDIVDWDRTDPLLQYVNVGAVELVAKPRLAKGVTDGDFEDLGYQIIVTGDTGPLVLKKRVGAKLTYYFMFHTDQSTLPYNIGFPIVVANGVQIALQSASLSEIRGQKTGVLNSESTTANADFNVVSPDGSSRDYKSDKNGLLQGIGAPVVGRYKISESGGETKQVGAALLDPLETSLASVKEIQFRELSVSAVEGMIDNDRPLWPILASLAFIVLLVEWWFFQKRPSGVPA